MHNSSRRSHWTSVLRWIRQPAASITLNTRGPQGSTTCVAQPPDCEPNRMRTNARKHQLGSCTWMTQSLTGACRCVHNSHVFLPRNACSSLSFSSGLLFITIMDTTFPCLIVQNRIFCQLLTIFGSFIFKVSILLISVV